MANIPGRRLRNPNRAVELRKLQLCAPLEEEDGSPLSDKTSFLDKNVWKVTDLTEEYTCLVCSKSMIGEVPARAHASSLKHLRKLSTLPEGTNYVDPETGSMMQQVDPSTCQATVDSEKEHIIQNDNGVQSNTVQENEFGNADIWELSDGSFTCLVCSKVMSGKTPAQDHLLSFKHVKKVAENQQQLQTPGPTEVESAPTIPEPIVNAPVIKPKLKSILKNGQNWQASQASVPESTAVVPEPIEKEAPVRRLRPRIVKNTPIGQDDVSSQKSSDKVVDMEGTEKHISNTEFQESLSIEVDGNKNVENVGGDFYKCLVCLVTVSGKSNMKGHLEGRLHLKSMNVRPRSASLENVTSPPKKVKHDNVDSSTKLETVNTTLKNVGTPSEIKPVDVQLSEKLEAPKDVVFESNETPVDIETINSKTTFVTPAYRPTATSAPSAVDSVDSSSSLSLEAKEDPTKLVGEEVEVKDVESNSEPKSNPVDPDGGAVDPNNHFADHSYVSRDGTDYRCLVCKIFVQQIYQMVDHLKGKKHLKLMQSYKPPDFSRTSVKNRLGGLSTTSQHPEDDNPVVVTESKVVVEEPVDIPVVEPLVDLDEIEEVPTLSVESGTVELRADPQITEPMNEIDGIRKLLTFGQFENTESAKDEDIVPDVPEQSITEETSSVFSRISNESSVQISVIERPSCTSPIQSVMEHCSSEKITTTCDSDDSDEEKYERFDRVSSRCDTPPPEIASAIMTLSTATRSYDRPRYPKGAPPMMNKGPPSSSSSYVHQNVSNTYMQPQSYMPSQQQYMGPSLNSYGNSPYGGGMPSYADPSPYGPTSYGNSPHIYGGPPSYGRVGPPSSSTPFSSITPSFLSYSPRYAPSSSAPDPNANAVLSRRLGPKLL